MAAAAAVVRFLAPVVVVAIRAVAAAMRVAVAARSTQWT